MSSWGTVHSSSGYPIQKETRESMFETKAPIDQVWRALKDALKHVPTVIHSEVA